jgi:hypothetical protein
VQLREIGGVENQVKNSHAERTAELFGGGRDASGLTLGGRRHVTDADRVVDGKDDGKPTPYSTSPGSTSQ